MTRLRRTNLAMALALGAAAVPAIGCAHLGAPSAPTFNAPAGPPRVELGEGQTATEPSAVEVQRPVVRAQSGDYSGPGYGNTGYGNTGFGGRSVGAMSPTDARGAPLNQSSYPNTPGARAWGVPSGSQPAATYPPTYQPSHPPAYIAPAGPPANYAAPSFSGAGNVGANRPIEYDAGAPPNVYLPGTAVSAPGGAFPGGIPPAPGINPNPGGTVQGDPMTIVDPYGTVDLGIYANETRTGRLMIGAGINSDAGLMGQFVIDEQNFNWARFPTSWDDIRNGYAWRGGGQRFRFEAMPGTHVHRYLVSLQEPYLFDTPFSLGLSAFFYDRRFYDWDEGRLGGRIALGYQFPRDWTATVSFRGENVEITNPRVLPAVPEVAEVLGSNTLYGVKVAVGHDTRDDAFLPTQGHVVEVGLEQVFGDFEYPIATVEARKFFTITERADTSGRHVLHVGGQAGWAGEDAPVYDHFYAGGYSTIRGFGFRGASPKNGDVIVGGEFQLLGTIEYMFPITADDMLRGVVFCDAGTIEEKHRIEWDDFRVAPGFGMRISNGALGPAPIALDLAFPIAHEDGDKIRNFSFFIGLRY